MTPLERRYRRLLRVLPGWYRRDREEEMVDTFLTERADRPDADLDLEYGSPGWAEVRATATLAVRTRFAASRPAGEVVRLIAVLGLLAQFVLAVPSVVSLIELRTRLDDVGIALVLGSAVSSMAPIVLLLAGFRTGARVAVVPAVATSVLWLTHWATVAASLPLWVAAGCLLVGFHREAAPIRTAPWWRALLAVTGMTAAWLVLVLLLPRTPLYAAVTDPTGLAVWLLLVGGTVWLIRVRTPVVALALAVVAASFVPAQIVLLQIAGLPQTAVQLVAIGVFLSVSSVISLGAKIRSGGPQKPAPRLV
jgi:hypothetical protein